MNNLFIVNVSRSLTSWNHWTSFFDGEGVAVTVNSNRYANMIDEFFNLHYKSGLLRTFGFSRTALSPYSSNIDGYFEENLSWPVDLFTRWHHRASTFTQFNPLRIYFMRLFESWGVQTAPKEPARPEPGNSRGVLANFSSHAWKSYWELKSALAAVFWQSGPPFVWNPV